jgi:glutamate dehydrogenase (NADP+)
MSYTRDAIDMCAERNPAEPEFHRAVAWFLEILEPVIEKHPEFRKAAILERLVEPDRSIIFPVPWMDDFGNVRLNTAYRVQFNNALGPYYGGLRFHPGLNFGILKYFAFERTLKNALTTLPLGGGMGGSDFHPRSHSDLELSQFFQAFTGELLRHIGPDTDVFGAGALFELNSLYGFFKMLKGNHPALITGKYPDMGGNVLRPEATGYGAVYFAAEMLKVKGESLEGKTALVSGSGNVAQFACEKMLQLGIKPLTLSDSNGYIYDEEGTDLEKLAFVMKLKNEKRGRIREYADVYPHAVYTPYDPSLGYNSLWSHKADLAFPCATQNEINAQDARNLVNNGVTVVLEASGSAALPEAVEIFSDNGIPVGSGFAANIGDLVVSGLEMSQNSMRFSWSKEEVDRHLRACMKKIHKNCLEASERYGDAGNYHLGAMAVGFERVAAAMLAQGIV